MAHPRSIASLSHRTESLERNSDSDIDSGVWDDADEEADHYLGSLNVEEKQEKKQDEVEENSEEGEDFTVFVAFRGNMDDEDFTQKLDNILSGIPNILDMGWLFFYFSICSSLIEQCR